MAEKYRIELQDIDKSFGGVHALKNAHLKVMPGEVHALVGGKRCREIYFDESLVRRYKQR